MEPTARAYRWLACLDENIFRHDPKETWDDAGKRIAKLGGIRRQIDHAITDYIHDPSLVNEMEMEYLCDLAARTEGVIIRPSL